MKHRESQPRKKIRPSIASSLAILLTMECLSLEGALAVDYSVAPPPSLTRQTTNIVFDQDNQSKTESISPITSGDEVNIIFNHTGGNLSPSSSASPSTIEINGGKLQIDINAANSTNTINAGLNFSNTNSGALTNTGVINFNENGTLNFTNSSFYSPSMYDSITSTMTININASGDSKIGGRINFGQQQTTINFSQALSSKFTLDMSNTSGSTRIEGITIVNFNHSNDTFEIKNNPSYNPSPLFQTLQINLNQDALGEKNIFIGDITVDTMSSSSSNNLLQSSINFNQENAYLLVDGKISSDVYIASTPNDTTRGLQINFLQGNGTLEIKPSTPSSNPGYPTMDSEIHDISGAIINIGNTNNEAHAHIISDFSSGSSTSRENYIIFQHDNSSLSVNGTFGSMNSMGSSMGKNTIRLDGANIAYVTTDLVGNYYNSYPSSPTTERPKNIIEIDSGKTLKLSSVKAEIPENSVKGFNIVFKGETGSFVGNLAGGVVMDFGEINNGGYPSNPPSFYTQTITFEGSIDTIYNGKYSGDNIFSFNSSPNQGMRDIVINSPKALRLNHQGGYANVFELAGSSSPSSSYGKNVTINTDIYLTGTLSQYPNPNPPGSSSYRREGNIFNISGGRLSLGGEDDRKTLYTQSGLTQLNFYASGSGGYFGGDVSTTGGVTQIILGYDGGSSYGSPYILEGNIQASGSGVNRFENWASGSNGGVLEIKGTITANDGGINIFTRDVSSSASSYFTKTFFDSLVFQASGGGENIIEIYSGESFSIKKVDNTQYPPNPSQSLMLGSIETKSGTTLINFKTSGYGGSTVFASNLTANGGNHLITFERVSQSGAPSTSYSDFDFLLELVANGENTNILQFERDINLRENTTFSNRSATIMVSGSNTNGGNIFQINEGITLSIAGYSTMPSLHTTSGSTRIEFLGKTGTFSGEILTSGGVTTFALLGGDSTSVSFGGTMWNSNFALTSSDSGVNKITFSGINSTLDLSHASTMLIQANGAGKNIFEIAYEGTQINYISPDGMSFQGDGQDLNGGNIVEFTSDNASLKIVENKNLSKLTVGSGVGKIEFNANNGSMLSLFKVGSTTSPMPPMGQTTLLQQGYVELNKENTQNTLKGMSVYYDKSMGASSYTLKTNGYINFNANQTILNIADGITLDGGSLDINFNANESELNSTFSFSNDSRLGIHLREANSYNKIDQILSAENGGIAISTLSKSGASVSNIIFETQGFQAKTHQIDVNFSGSGGTSTLVAENIVSEGANINISFIENGKIQGNLKALSGTSGQNGINAISFQKNGAIVGDISSSGGSNELHLGGGVYAIDGDVSSSGGSNRIVFEGQGKLSFLGSRTQSILASNNGKNHFYFDDTADTFTITGDVYAKSSDNGVNLFEIGGGKELRFADGADTKSLVTTLGKTTISFSDTQPNKQATGSFVGNLVANGGDNEVVFSDDGVFGFRGKIEASSGNKNTFIISQNVSFANDIETSNQSSGENIFQVGNGKTLQFGENADKTLKTYSGDTIISLASSSAVKGNISAFGGQNKIEFDTSGGGQYQARIDSDFQTQDDGKNIFEISGAQISVISDSAIEFSGEKLGAGFNQILFSGTNNTLSLKNIQGAKLQTFKTTSGLTHIDFEGSNSVLEANIATLGGETVFGFGDTNGVTTSVTATMGGDIANSACNTFNLYAQTVNLKLKTGFAFRDGDNIINFKKDGITFNWSDSSGVIQSIMTSGGNTVVNFSKSGSINGGIITNGLGATTTIKIADAKKGIVADDIKTSQGNTKVEFNGSSILELQGEMNQISQIAFGENAIEGTLILDATTSAVTTTLDSIAGDKLVAQLKGTSGKSATLNLNNGGTLKSINVASGTYEQNILNLKGGNTTITQAINSTVITGNGLTINLDGASKFVTTGGIDNAGTKTINISSLSGDGVISGGNINANNLDIASSSSLAFQNAQSTFASAGGEGTLILDGNGAKSNVSVNIKNEINTNGLNVLLKGSLSGGNELVLEKGGLIKSIALSPQSINNMIFIKGENKRTTIVDKIKVGQGEKVAFNLEDQTTFVLRDGADSRLANTESKGVITLVLQGKVGGSTVALEGGDTSISNLVFQDIDSQTFRIRNANSSFGTLTSGTNQDSLLVLDTTSSGVSVSIETIIGNRLSAQFNGAINKTATLNLNNGGTLKSIEIASGNQEQNILNLKDGNTSIGEKVVVGTNKGITFSLTDGAALAFANELEIEKDGDVLFGLDGVNTIEGIVANNGVVAFDVNAPQTILNSAIDFSSGNNTINFRYGDSSDVASLSWRDVDGNSQRAINTNGGVTTINFFENGILFADLNTSKGVTNIRLADGKNAIISGTLITTDGVTNVGFDGGNSRLILKNNAIITNVVNSSTKKIAYGENNGISLYYKNRTDKVFKTLTIGKEHTTDTGIEGEGLKFLVYATDNRSVSSNGVYADKVVILSSKNGNSIDGSVKESTHHLGVKFDDGVKFENIGYEKGANNNILVATVADSSGVKFEKSDKTILGFVSADVDFITTATNKDGEAGVGYTSYYVGQLKNGEVLAAEQEITATAFALNYDLYMANFNSLNKRMGELRDNSHSQGVWARVFNGAQTNNMGLGSKSSYTTIQAGYDYAFGSEGANNYLGFALSYALSTSTSDKAFDDMGRRRGIEGIYSNAVEVAAYNSYVSDNGWYNDTIVKFSYLMSSFNINNLNTGSSTSNKTSNFALTLSDEIGYTFRFGNIGEWSIVPQIEAVFGYFNQSDFKQVFESSTAFLESMADSVITMRVRTGSSLGYDFKQFTQDKDVNASIYMGAFYEYDYISGGDISYRTNTTQNLTYNTLSNIQSDGRMVINIGTNMTIKDNTRLYFDFEKSFMGNITTDYQVNFGVRYSFGDSDGYTPITQNVETQEENKAPLKIKEKDTDKEKLGSQKEKIEDKKGDSSQEVQDNNEVKQEDDNNKNLNTKKNKKSIE